MARYAVVNAISELTEKRNTLRAKAKAFQNKRQRNRICVKTHNLLLHCAELTVAIVAIKNMGVA